MLFVDYNYLTGPLPANICSACPFLLFYASSNLLTGTIPSSYSDTRFFRLWINENQIAGNLSIFRSVPNRRVHAFSEMEDFMAQNNLLTGVPLRFAYFSPSSLLSSILSFLCEYVYMYVCMCACLCTIFLYPMLTNALLIQEQFPTVYLMLLQFLLILTYPRTISRAHCLLEYSTALTSDNSISVPTISTVRFQTCT